MSGPDEVVQEFFALTDDEMGVAEAYEEEICEAGASSIFVKYGGDGEPNRLEIWGPTRTDVENATEKYVEYQETEL